MAKIVGKCLEMVGYGTGGLGTNNWAADMEANLRKIDAILQAGAVAIQNGPPGSPVDGQVYVVGTSPTGAWASNANAIARWNGNAAPSGAWEFFAPAAGWWIAVGSQDYRFSGAAWVAGWTPAHGPTHEFGGADPITGQNLTGLRVSDSPAWAQVAIRATSTIAPLPFQSSAGSRRFEVRWDEGNDRLAIFSGNDDGTQRSNRILVPRSDSSPVWVGLGLNVASGALQVGGVDSVTATREGRFTGLRLSNMSAGQIPVSSDANGQITASGQTDDGTYLTSSRVFRSWNTLTKTGNVWSAIQWTQATEERASLFSSDASGANARPVIMLAHNETEAVDRTLGIIAAAQKVSGKTGSNPGVKVDLAAITAGAGGTNGGFGGRWVMRYRPDNGANMADALRVGVFGGGTADAVEAAILLRANADFLANYAKIQKDADASVGLDVVGPSGTGKFRMLNSVGGSVLGINVGSLEISCANGIGIGTTAGNAGIGVLPGGVSIAKTYFSSTHRVLPTERNSSASTAIDDRLVVYTGTTNHTESLPAATGSNRVIEFAHASSSGTWTLDAAGTDEIAGDLQARVGSIAILSNSSVKNRTLIDFAPGLWVVI